MFLELLRKAGRVTFTKGEVAIMKRAAILSGTAFVGIALIFCVIVAIQPSDFKVTRSILIDTTPEKPFDQVNDFHKWENWSPWAKLDPAMKTTYSGPTSGNRAAYSWVGNSSVGSGRMTINSSDPYDHIGIDLEFTRPFSAFHKTDFIFRIDGDRTNVTWTMTGKNNFVSKAFGLFVDMDKMIGTDFEKGLAQLKNIAEADANAG